MEIQDAKNRLPIIGIVPALLPDDQALQIRQNYIDAIIEAGGVPMLLPLTSDFQVYETLFPLIDGFLLTGGCDINPARYGVEPSSDKLSELTPSREEVECLILSYAYQFDIPVLGICRGMQMINVFFGGTLYLDLADQFNHAEKDGNIAHWQKDDYEKPTHFVKIVRSSKLNHIMETEHLETNSMHHQGIRELGALLDPVAYGPDGLVEAVEVRDRSFILGVQWHPEFFAGKKNMGCLFASLVQEAQRTALRQRTVNSGMIVTACHNQPCMHSFTIPANLRIETEENTEDKLWPSITFADSI